MNINVILMVWDLWDMYRARVLLGGLILYVPAKTLSYKPSSVTWLWWYIAKFSLAVVTHYDQKKPGEERVISLTPIIIIQPREKSRQECGGRNWSHSLACLSMLAHLPRASCPVSSTPMGWALSHHSLIKETFHRLTYRPFLGDPFSVEVPSSHGTLA